MAFVRCTRTVSLRRFHDALWCLVLFFQRTNPSPQIRARLDSTLFKGGVGGGRAAWWMQNLTRASTHPPAWQQHELTTGKGGWMGWGRKKNRAHTRPHAQPREERSSATGACCHYRYYCDCRRHCLSPHSSRYPSSQSSNSITHFFFIQSNLVICNISSSFFYETANDKM